MQASKHGSLTLLIPFRNVFGTVMWRTYVFKNFRELIMKLPAIVLPNLEISRKTILHSNKVYISVYR